MSTPVQVVVVRPKKTTEEKAAAILDALGTVALNAWILMLALGSVATWHPSYWQTVLVILGARTLQREDYLAWTRDGAK